MLAQSQLAPALSAQERPSSDEACPAGPPVFLLWLVCLDFPLSMLFLFFPLLPCGFSFSPDISALGISAGIN